MNGPQHYREAEADINRANGAPMGGEAEFYLGRAQVHATLAAAAATALTETGGSERIAAWAEVTAS